MSKAMKTENMKNYVKELGIANEGNIIFGLIDAKFWKYMLFIAFMVLFIKRFLLCFEKEKIILLGVTIKGDFSNHNTEILRTKIKSINYKSGLLQGRLKIDTIDGKYSFKIPKVIIGAPWQKENLTSLIQCGFE